MTDEPEILHCGQMLQPQDDCCAGTTTCQSAAAWIHQESGVALCELHERNARTFGGLKFREWTVGLTKVSYPEGWTHVDDGLPLTVEEPAPAAAAPARPSVGGATLLEVPATPNHPSGLILP